MNGYEHTFMPSTSFGRDSLLQMHIDFDYFLSIVTLHHDNTKNELKDEIIKYFTFDNYISVALRNNDILIFNPAIKHSVSTKTEKF